MLNRNGDIIEQPPGTASTTLAQISVSPGVVYVNVFATKMSVFVAAPVGVLW